MIRRYLGAELSWNFRMIHVGIDRNSLGFAFRCALDVGPGANFAVRALRQVSQLMLNRSRFLDGPSFAPFSWNLFNDNVVVGNDWVA